MNCSEFHYSIASAVTKLHFLVRNYLAYLMATFLLLGIGFSYPKINGIYFCTIIFWIYVVLALLRRVRWPFFAAYRPDWISGLLFLSLFWSLIACFWSWAPMEGVRQSAFCFILVTSVFLISSHFNDSLELKKLFNWIAVLVAAHFFLSSLEIFTSFRWPISPLSKYVTAFGRQPWVTGGHGFDRATLSYPTSFYWNPNNASIVSFLVSPFFFFSKRVFVVFLGTFAVGLVVCFARARSHFLLLPIELCFSALVFSIVATPKGKFATALGRLCIALLAFGLSVGLFVNTATKESVVELGQSYTALKAYAYKGASYLYRGYGSHSGWDTDGVDFDYASDKFGLSQRLIMQKKVLENISWDNWFGIGAGSLKKLTYLFEGKETPLIAPHNFWLEILSEYGNIFFAFAVGWHCLLFLLLWKTLFSNQIPIDIRLRYLAPFVVSFPFFLIGVITVDSVFYFFPFCLFYALAITFYRLPRIQRF